MEPLGWSPRQTIVQIEKKKTSPIKKRKKEKTEKSIS
jgi:hypothetical protein